MLTWLESLTMLELILFYIAVPATLLLLLQTALLFVGGGGDQDMDGDGIPDELELDGEDLELETDDADLDGDGAPDGEVDSGGQEQGGLRLLTLRGIVAFFCLFGWSGLLFCQIGLHWLLALFLAVQAGIVGMVAVAFVLREALRLQSDGTLDIRNALGKHGSVYLTVPPGRSGVGKVNVLVQEQLREFEAVTEEESAIPTGAEVLVSGITGGDTLVVKVL